MREDYSPHGDGFAADMVPQHHVFAVPAGGRVQVRVRLTNQSEAQPFACFDELVALWRQEADEFYEQLQAELTDPDARLMQRQALAGMLWTKQFYYYVGRQEND